MKRVRRHLASMADALWPLDRDQSLLLAALGIFYLGVMLGMIGGYTAAIEGKF
jgi:hypothetical protein